MGLYSKNPVVVSNQDQLERYLNRSALANHKPAWGHLSASAFGFDLNNEFTAAIQNVSLKGNMTSPVFRA